MQLRAFGGSALHVSAMGLGCNNIGHIDDDEARGLVHKALDLGVNLFDTADVYADGRSESDLGRLLGAHRNSVLIATKFGHPKTCHRPGAREHVFASAEASLRRLGTDWIDLYQMHFPDPETPIEETLSALEALIDQGKVRFIGCSNFSARQLDQASQAGAECGTAKFIGCQAEYSLLSRAVETEILPAAARLDLGFLPFFPLASGLLSGKHQSGQDLSNSLRARVVNGFVGRFISDDNWGKLARIEAVCRDHGWRLVDAAIAWLLSDTRISSVIAGATKAAQLEQNAEAANRIMPAPLRNDLIKASSDHGFDTARHGVGA